MGGWADLNVTLFRIVRRWIVSPLAHPRLLHFAVNVAIRQKDDQECLYTQPPLMFGSIDLNLWSSWL